MECDKVFRALGDKHRLRIMDLLMEREMNAGEMLEQVNVVQSTLSHHMKSLCEAGLVIARRDKKWTYYSVSSEAVEQAREYLKRYLTGEAVAEATPADGVQDEPQTAAKKKCDKAVEQPAEVPQEDGAQLEETAEAEPQPTLYASMKPSKKKKEDKEKKNSDKKKAGKKKQKKAGKKESKKTKE